MDRKQAEDFVYKSYIKAQKYQSYHSKDSEKRRNDLTFDLIRKKSKTPCAVVTGSKGKGSVANMISQILQTKYTVGLMTSPHIVDFCERFRVNGGKISEEEFVKQIEGIQPEIEAIDKVIPKEVCISPMGIQTYLALNYFQNMGTQFNVFECGKGAKYDDVNNVKHEYAVINSIFLEHTRELGETIEEIAEDKAHVITGEQKCVYVAEQKPGVLKIIQNRAEELHVSVKVYGQDFWAENVRYTKEGMIFDVIIGEEVFFDISIPLLGEHQAKNCALALALCIDVFENLSLPEEKNVFVESNQSEKRNVFVESNQLEEKEVIEDSTKKRLRSFNFIKIKEKLLNINWPGRMEVLGNNPFMLLDACIHKASCENVLKVLHYLDIKEAALVVGIPDDKDYVGVVRNMKEVASDIILTKSQNSHYVFTKRQQERLKEEGIDAEWTDSVLEAIHLAKKKEKPIVILGTTSVVGEVKKIV